MSYHINNLEPLGAGGTVAGLFYHAAQAERAIRDLEYAGFRDEQLGVMLVDRPEHGHRTSLVAALSLVSGMRGLVIPGIGPAFVAGTLASSMARAGDLTSVLLGTGITEDEARHYERELREGAILVTADAGPRADDAHQILLVCGADFGAARRRPAWDAAQHFHPSKEELRPAERPVSADESQREERRVGRDAGYAGPERRLVTM